MGQNLIKNIQLGLFLLIAISLSLPVAAEQNTGRHHKSHHAVKHQKAHPKNAVHKKTTHKKKIKTAKVANQSLGEVYIVQPGDVFGKVAQKYQPAGVSLKQVMRAIYAKNKNAFVNGDQKRLIVGAKLAIPSSLVPKKVEIEKVETAVTSAPVKSQASVTSKSAEKTPSGLAPLEDDPKNKASQIKTPLPATADQQPSQVVSNQTPAVNSATTPASALTPAAAAETVSPAVSEKPIVSAGEIPATEEPPVEVRRDTGINGFVLVTLIIIALFGIAYLRIRARKIEKNQQDLINELMRKRDEETI
jgi:FimV-like protein